ICAGHTHADGRRVIDRHDENENCRYQSEALEEDGERISCVETPEAGESRGRWRREKETRHEHGEKPGDSGNCKAAPIRLAREGLCEQENQSPKEDGNFES